MRLLDDMRRHGAPGWWRAGADLDNYSTLSQDKIAANIAHMLERAASDGEFRTFTTGGTDETGRWVYIFASGAYTKENCDHLELYLTAKKHQQHADRALGVLMNHDGAPEATLWLAYPPENDAPELDAVARAMGLVPPDRAPAAIPPKARGRKKSRKRNRGARRG